jgi:uncharacterized protein YndB with AHSA1/START domain
MTASNDFVFSRLVSAPRPRVWAAWTERDRLAKWWGPKGMPLAVLALDVRPGGLFHYSMELPSGDKWFGRFDYEAVEAPSRLVYVSGFADAAGARTRPPFSPTFPLLVRNELVLEDRGRQTLISLRGHALDASAEEIATFTGMFPSMQQGFGGTFDQLEAHLDGGV